MRFTSITLSLMLFAVVLMVNSGCSKSVKQKPENDQPTKSKKDDKPKVTTEGPLPKLVMAEKVHQFGAMMVGDKKKHTFVIKNEGEGVLKLKMGPSSCGKCSKFTLKDTEVQPGGTTEILAEWFPTELDENFRKNAHLFSNDAKSKDIEIVLEGIIDGKILLPGARDWTLQSFQKGKPSVLKKYVFSRVLDNFELTKLEINHPFIKASSAKMTPEELKPEGAKFGYTITITVSAEIPVGGIIERLTIATDVEGEKDYVAFVKGSRVGPIRFSPLPGVRFRRDEMIIDMQKFSGRDGRTGKLQMFIEEAGETPFEILSVEHHSKILKVDLQEDKKFKGKNKRRFILTLEVPPGSPSVYYANDKAVKLVIKTNHPGAKEIQLKVSFVTL